MGRARRGMTLLEVLLAMALLGAALVPVYAMIAEGLAVTRDIELRTRATFLAEQEVERVLAEAAADYDQDFDRFSADLGGGFLVTVLDLPQTAFSKRISVRVAWDADGNGSLSNGEVLASLMTLVADTTTLGTPKP